MRSCLDYKLPFGLFRSIITPSQGDKQEYWVSPQYLLSYWSAELTTGNLLIPFQDLEDFHVSFWPQKQKISVSRNWQNGSDTKRKMWNVIFCFWDQKQTYYVSFWTLWASGTLWEFLTSQCHVSRYLCSIPIYIYHSPHNIVPTLSLHACLASPSHNLQ